MNREIRELRNLGPRCEDWLATIGIHDEAGLRRVGAPAAYRELVHRGVARPHRMLLYALAGALEDQDCTQLSRDQKLRLVEQAEG